ncbi:MAG: hypothetical protein AAFU60_05280 [Bacteroidota bacterium]
MRPYLLSLLGISCSIALFAQTPPRKFKLPNTLNEVSGLYIERADRWWWHNDSGNSADLFTTNERGENLERIPISGLKNQDWEDLTVDDQGIIYIGEFGNNCHCRNNLKIYRYDPQSGVVDSILYHYEDQTSFPPTASARNFNMEGFFWHRDSLHLFSKNKLQTGNYYTKHYVLSAKPGEQVAQIRDSLFLKKRVVTGAAISEDGQKVALIAYNFRRLLGFIPISGASVFVFEQYPDGHYLRGQMERIPVPPFFLSTQYESIDFWDKQTVYIASERTVFVKPRARRIKLSSSE